jgi:protein tyrosine/serine phosphatase
MKFLPRRTALRVVLALAAIPAAILIFQAGLRETGNFHEVIAGELYRSAQPSASSLRHEAEQYGIRTVINLRGAHPGVGWYDDEKRTAEAMGLRLIDFPMSASRELTHGQAARLVTTLRDAEKPILIHCNTGADRTGLVSIIYASQIAGIDEETAEEQLSPLFGHFGIPLFSPTFAMDESWEDLESFFGIVGS